MRQRRIYCMLMIGLSAVMLTGCEREIAAVPDTETSAIAVVEAVETETKQAPEMIKESVDANQVTEEVPDLRVTYKSSIGFQMKYDKAVFEYNQHGGYDEFVRKTKVFSSDPLVFFAAMRIEAQELDTVRTEIFAGEPAQTVIGEGDYPALCSRSSEMIDKGKYTQYHSTYLVALDDGDALLFETQWFAGETEDTAGEELTQMLQSLVIENAAPDRPEAAGETMTEAESETEGETLAQ